MQINEQHESEKRWAAATSLGAALGITIFKIVVGVMTQSLGILAEAAHSGLDLVAAAATFWTIRYAGRPADREHPYGHGKAENLSALFQTVLLLITCAWILYEAVHRLSSGETKVDVNRWAYLVMFTSVAVDFSRSRALSRAAKKHNSQALEADAVHFQTDIWSSLGVIVGLACVWVGQQVAPLWFLKYSDVVAAVGVAVITVWVTWRLGLRTVLALLDTAPPGVDEKIKQVVEALPEVQNCHNVRVRTSGPQVFVEVHVWIDGNQTLAKTHDQMDVIELAIRNVLPNADVTVHPEPLGVE
jgi:cation diffusion facilitator family transporter